MKIQEIDNAVENNKCPAPLFCTVATTCYDSHTRERKCLKCWLEYCKANDYGGFEYENPRDRSGS